MDLILQNLRCKMKILVKNLLLQCMRHFTTQHSTSTCTLALNLFMLSLAQAYTTRVSTHNRFKYTRNFKISVRFEIEKFSSSSRASLDERWHRTSKLPDSGMTTWIEKKIATHCVRPSVKAFKQFEFWKQNSIHFCMDTRQNAYKTYEISKRTHETDF